MKASDLSVFISPVLLAAWHFTQHGAFLYLFGVWTIVLLFAMLLILAVMVVLYLTDQETTLNKIRRGKPILKGKIALGVLINLLILTYLLYNSFFGLSTLFILLMVPTYVLLTLLYNYRNAN